MATYLILNLAVIATLAGVCMLARINLPRRWIIATLVLIILTAVFDNLIVWLGIVTYDPARILGIRLGTAPVEDFAYAIGASLLVPLLWQKGNKK